MDATDVIQFGRKACRGSSEKNLPAVGALRTLMASARVRCARIIAESEWRIGSDDDWMDACWGVYDKYVRYACRQADRGIAAGAINGEEIGHIDAVWGGDGVGLGLGLAN